LGIVRWEGVLKRVMPFAFRPYSEAGSRKNISKE
jgi:hypothetical protein